MRGILSATALFLILIPVSLFAQDEFSERNHEFGFWVGGSFPVPSTGYDDVIDSNVGAGGFYRINWPLVFMTEFGFSYTSYFSQTTQAVNIAPVHLSLVYPLPLPFRMQVMVKGGLGSTHVTVRPMNKQGWIPSAYGGLEFSIMASRRLRVGLRLDYNYLHENHLSPPREQEWARWIATEDLRYRTDNFEVRDGHFYHFGLMVSFVL